MGAQQDSRAIDSVVEALLGAKSVLFITGAGVSAESGIPTYRGIGGLYNLDTTDDGVPIEVALSGAMLAKNPALTWKYLAQIGMAVQGAAPNAAHHVIASMESHFERLWVLTQNVDGFHHAAGSKNLIEVHGNMHSLSCTRCDYHVNLEHFNALNIPPSCPECDSLVRPDVILFGELLNAAGIEIMSRELETGFDIVFSVGTTSVFPYIRAPIYMANSRGKMTVELNPSETSVSQDVTHRIGLPAGAALSEIWNKYLASASR